jgi:TPR repeat protein
VRFERHCAVAAVAALIAASPAEAGPHAAVTAARGCAARSRAAAAECRELIALTDRANVPRALRAPIVRTLRPACERKRFEPRACTALGLILILANEPQRKVIPIFERACAAGELRGCNGYAALYRGIGQGDHVQSGERRSNPSLAVALFRYACERGEQRSCVNLGDALLLGEVVPRDVARGVRLMKAACDAGDGLGCGVLAEAYYLGQGVVADARRARALARSGCDLRQLGACAQLALYQYEGIGGPRDQAAALATLRPICSPNRARVGPACYLLGRARLIDGDAVGAAVAFQFACDEGDRMACAVLGELYLEGRGVQRQAGLGEDLVDRGCHAGAAEACATLGTAWQMGAFGQVDLRRARWYRERACGFGVARACEESVPR